MHSRRAYRLIALLLLLLLAGFSGCALIPERIHQPVIRNPFPQLSRVAVIDFFNQSGEPTLDGSRVAEAYAGELAQFQGYEVVAVSTTMRAIRDQQIRLGDPREHRRLANYLGVDAIVIGTVTEYSPYSPPRMGMTVRWYAANPCFHPIPSGYGLPWGTTDEEFIPDALVYEAELALAKEQMRTQTPTFQPEPVVPPQNESAQQPEELPLPKSEQNGAPKPMPEGAGDAASGGASIESAPALQPAMHVESTGATDASVPTVATGMSGATLPPGWPDPRGFTPPGPSPVPAPCRPNNAPVMEQSRVYQGHDADFSASLSHYVSLRDDSRFDGWQGYLQRSGDFIRFCCHKHIAEMISARGGADKSRVVYRWHKDR